VVIAGERLIGLAVLTLDAEALGLAHGVHHRRGAGFVAVNADAEVELVRPRIGAVAGHDAVQRVAGRLGKAVEHLFFG
jgi:hypothetical protein